MVNDEPRVAVNTDYPSVIFYDPFSPESVIYTESGTPERIAEISGYVQYRFHAAFSANFNGGRGNSATRSERGARPEGYVAGWSKVQMLERVKEPEKVYPINPFAQQAR
ncbi:hypothetical protein [Paraburkholderia atlantica]|uniref:hypothetical protein n=1 Tax=Paraburkholderia atlantica TaxID=2654982 RepID=UPI003D1A18F3